jgi:hypothetical protein
MQRTRAGWLSLVGIYLGLGIVLVAFYKISQTWTASDAPLLFIGLLIGCISTPAYYYFKAKDKTVKPYTDVEIQTLATLGAQKQEDNKKDN